jgi:serpin B
MTENHQDMTLNASEGDLHELVQGNSTFACTLYRVLCNDDGNLFVSPFSISCALAMTYAGAHGRTERQMAETLHLTLSQDRMHPAFQTLAQKLIPPSEGRDSFQISLANRIWGQTGYEFLPAFLDTLSAFYSVGLHALNFSKDPEAARKIINDWVLDKTEGKIKDLIPPGNITKLTSLVLTNAIYFKGKWQRPFKEAKTRKGSFTRLDGRKVRVQMMSQDSVFNYTQGESYQAVELPYRDTQCSMLFILPKEGHFEGVEANLSPSFISRISTDLDFQMVDLSVPKYKFKSGFMLSRTLQQMGMIDAFGDADFSGMTGKRDLYISQVIHKAFVAVDEEGTEAAAATAVTMVRMGLSAPTGVKMKMDRPFLFIIRDNATGTILFIGRVLDPRN